MHYRTSSPFRCQIRALALLAALAAAPARAAEPVARDVLLERLGKVKISGSMSLNWRNVGPRKPGFETQIQNQVYLADMYFGAEGPVLDGVPFLVEWQLPTAKQGQPQLHQAYFEYNRLRRLRFQFGKFAVPFGRYNELYHPDDFLAVTRPLLYASPDSLDLVVRPNSPRPPVSLGYSDVGARFSWYPVRAHPLIPSEVTLFVVNGLGEQRNRSRTFPDPQNLGIPGPPTNGVSPDFGHENNNLADNNNAKSVGARVVFALGDLRLPWPVPERAADLDGVHLGLSGMNGQYDLEGVLDYQIYGLDWSMDYRGISLSGEAMYSTNRFLTPILTAATTPTTPVLRNPVEFAAMREHLYGHFVQASFPVMRRPPYGRRLTGVMVFNQAFRRGPLLDFLLNYNDGSTTYPSMTAWRHGAPFITREIRKYTGGLHYLLAPHFAVKFEYSYWTMNRSTVRSETSLGINDITQSAFSLVMGF